MLVRKCTKCGAIIPVGESRCKKCSSAMFGEDSNDKAPAIIYALVDDDDISNQVVHEEEQSKEKEISVSKDACDDGFWMTSGGSFFSTEKGVILLCQIWDGEIEVNEKIHILDLNTEKILATTVKRIETFKHHHLSADKYTGFLGVITDLPKDSLPKDSVCVISKQGNIQYAKKQYEDREMNLVDGFSLNSFMHPDITHPTLRVFVAIVTDYYQSLQNAVIRQAIPFDEALERTSRIQTLSEQLDEIIEDYTDRKIEPDLSRDMVLFTSLWNIPYPIEEFSERKEYVDSMEDMSGRLKDLSLGTNGSGVLIMQPKVSRKGDELLVSGTILTGSVETGEILTSNEQMQEEIPQIQVLAEENRTMILNEGDSVIMHVQASNYDQTTEFFNKPVIALTKVGERRPRRTFTAELYVCNREEGGYMNQRVRIADTYVIEFDRDKVVATVTNVDGDNHSFYGPNIKAGSHGLVTFEMNKPIMIEKGDELLLHKQYAEWYRIGKGQIVD